MMSKADILTLVSTADLNDLPDIIGDLAKAQALAMVRLQSSPANPSARGDNAARGGPDEVVDADTLGAELDLKPSWLRAQARAGTLPHIRCGKYVKFRRGDVLAALRKDTDHRMGQTGQAEKRSNGVAAVSAGFHGEPQ